VLALLFMLALAVPAFDTDGDGIIDRQGLVLADADNDGSFDDGSFARPGVPGAGILFSDSLQFAQTWTSGTILNNQWDAYCGYLDDDSLLDLLGHHWNPNVLHVFESDGAGGYNHRWQQTESLPPGSYCTVTSGDPDDDGEVEILGGEVSTLGKVVVFENVADDSWALPAVPIRLRNERIRTVRVADTDGDDTNEIVVICGETGGGGVYIYEHSGPPGVHVYVERYHYTTVSYLFQGEVGDADNDGYPEVLLGVGGWHGFPMYIRRIWYDTATCTYSHKMFESSVIGLHLTPLACDVDSNGSNELVVGSSGDPAGQLHVFKYAGNDSFLPVWSSSMTTEGNVISAAAASFEGFRTPLFFAAPFAGAVYGFVADDTAFHCVSCFSPGTGSAIRSIDAARDGLDQLLLAESAPADYMSVWRREPGPGVFEARHACRQQPLTARPNPARGAVSVTADVALCDAAVFDAAGRLVARLGSGTRLAWNAAGAAAGVYRIQARTESGSCARLVVLAR
jgi:hypothetical protein